MDELTLDELFFYFKCYRKQSFGTEDEALAIVAAQGMGSRGEPLIAFQCSRCGEWHMGKDRTSGRRMKPSEERRQPVRHWRKYGQEKYTIAEIREAYMALNKED